MSEIRDKVISEAADLIRLNYEKLASWEIAKLIIGLHELAIVDRGAELPDMVFYCEDCDKMVKNTRCNIVDAGWVKEIK